MKPLTLATLRKLLKDRGGLLKSGNHGVDGECLPGEVCVRELRSIAIMNGVPYRHDHPDGDTSSPTDCACQTLNDGQWSSDQARTEACLPLALLSEATAIPDWHKGYSEGAIRVSASLALRFAAAVHPNQSHRDALTAAAERCASEGAYSAARSARSARSAADAAADAAYSTYAAYAAADAARSAARSAYAAYAAYAVAARSAYAATDAAYSAYSAAYSAYSAYSAYAARSAADAAVDAVLRVGVALLISAHKTPQPWLDKSVAKAVKAAEALIPEVK